MESNYPEIIYKYRDWSDPHHKRVLTKNELYLASPSDFNDPFDCRIAPNFKLLDTKEKIQRYVDEATIRHFETLTKQNRDLKFEMKRIEERLTNNIEDVQKDHEKQLFNTQDTYYGILSLSCRWDSILMWSHYANNHKGYCVGFWEEKLRNSNLFGSGGQIHYYPENEYPLIDPFEKDQIENILHETQSKAYDWKYEEEFRIKKLFFPKIPTKEDRIITIPDDFISEIILGLSITEEDENEIIEIAKAKGIEVYKTEKVPFKFEIARVEVK